MTKVTLMIERLQDLLAERIKEVEDGATDQPEQLLIELANNEATRQANLRNFLSQFYSTLNREYCRTTSNDIMEAVWKLTLVVLRGAIPRFRPKEPNKPKMSHLYAALKRYFTQTFNLHALLLLEKLQTATHYTPIFCLNMVVRQLVEISSEDYLKKVRKMVSGLVSQKKNQETVKSPHSCNLQTKEQEEKPAEKPVERIVYKSRIRVPKLISAAKSARHREPSGRRPKSKREVVQSPKQEAQNPVIISRFPILPVNVEKTCPRKLSLQQSPRRYKQSADISQRQATISNSTAVTSPTSTPSTVIPASFQSPRDDQNSLTKKQNLICQLYGILCIDWKNVKDLAKMTSSHYNQAIKSNSRHSLYTRQPED